MAPAADFAGQCRLGRRTRSRSARPAALPKTDGMSPISTLDVTSVTRPPSASETPESLVLQRFTASSARLFRPPPREKKWKARKQTSHGNWVMWEAPWFGGARHKRLLIAASFCDTSTLGNPQKSKKTATSPPTAVRPRDRFPRKVIDLPVEIGRFSTEMVLNAPLPPP
jgi:hypothetical protein